MTYFGTKSNPVSLSWELFVFRLALDDAVAPFRFFAYCSLLLCCKHARLRASLRRMRGAFRLRSLLVTHHFHPLREYTVRINGRIARLLRSFLLLLGFRHRPPFFVILVTCVRCRIGLGHFLRINPLNQFHVQGYLARSHVHNLLQQNRFISDTTREENLLVKDGSLHAPRCCCSCPMQFWPSFRPSADTSSAHLQSTR